jgi:predicted nucleic acid-binding protein
MIVVDASLAVKWFLSEVGSDAALAFFFEHEGSMASPDLILIEVAATFVRRANMFKAEAADMDDALDKWTKLLTERGIKLFRVSPASMRDAAFLAQTLGHPLKDCIYLGLARELDCDFVTCDARFAAKASLIYSRTRTLTV